MSTAIKEKILEDLERLSSQEQKRVQEFVHALVVSRPKGTPGKNLLHLAGTIDQQSIREMEEAIEEGCERVDVNEW